MCQQTCEKVKENQGKFSLKRRKKTFNIFQCKDKFMQYAQAYLNVHWSFILSFSQVNLWFKEPYVFYSCTTESDELSSSECCWKENLQLKVAALTQQPKKMVCTLSKTICWNIKKGLITKISFKIFQNLKFESQKKIEFCWHCG